MQEALVRALGSWPTDPPRDVGIALLRGALARDRMGEYQAQAAIAALHADAPRAEETDWVQIVEWYDELVRLTPSPVALLNRAVAVGRRTARPPASPSCSGSPRGCRAGPRNGTT